MPELPELTPEFFEILVVRELRKAGLAVSELLVHRRAALPEPEHGYVLELRGVVSRGAWREHVLIGCRRQDAPLEPAAIAAFRAHVAEAGAVAGILFATATFGRAALVAAREERLVLLRVADGRTAFDTSGWGTPGHYPAWLPAYCAQAVARDALGEPCYQLLDEGQGDVIARQLARPAPDVRAGDARGRPGESTPERASGT